MKKKILIPVVVLILAAIAIMAFRGKSESTEYRTVAIERGTIEEVVSATGALQATETIEVGTQVSGQIAELLVDFNDRVRKGQLLARIDPTILSNEVRGAEASVARSKAELDQAERALTRNQKLFGEKVITESELEQSQYSRSVAAASYAAATVSLERARRNLGYTEIRAPIDGMVVERSVDVGQTVAASTSAPKLFVIAQDLSKMQILASVDESDIGRIEQGQQVRFTVQAFGERQFKGKVEQVRLQSTTQDNVVSYAVVVEVGNPDGVLLPGMTATVEFLVKSADDVFKVSNAALRFQPEAANIAQRTAEAPVSAVRPAAQRQRAGNGARANVGTLWQVTENGQLEPLRVRTGLSDGQYTEVMGEELSDELEVVAGTMSSSAATATSNPFQAQQQRGPAGPARGF